MPCGKTNIPPAKLVTRLPDESNLRSAGRSEPPQVFTPHRSATQMDLPSGSISTALVAPQVLPSGIFAQFSIVRYGLGRSLTGLRSLWVNTFAPENAIMTTIINACSNLAWLE